MYVPNPYFCPKKAPMTSLSGDHPSAGLKLYNTLTRQKELFVPLNPPFVGLYVCGPTLYNFVHLGNLRTFLTFDTLVRYLRQLGYQVRYVRNITDVGHLENDQDEGEDKIAKKARLEKLEPMEIVHRFTHDFHQVLDKLNFIPPSIEPTATGHIVEQQQLVSDLLSRGLAYEVNGSVYFDVATYQEQFGGYGQLSGRIIEELISETRELEGTAEKKNPLDFALWKKASPQHIMRWSSPWGEGFPGWHLECTCMSSKYLGEQFDIHGGGMDLKFPHHECEIAQATAAYQKAPVRYWMHSNTLTINGDRMSKSKGNSILPAQLFSGKHALLQQAYSPMTTRFFMLQAQYRSTLDITNEALQAAGKGYRRLINGLRYLKSLSFQADERPLETKHLEEIRQLQQACYQAMNDDLNTAVVIAQLFNMLKKINQLQLGQLTMGQLGEEAFDLLSSAYIQWIEEMLGLKEETPQAFESLVENLMFFYKEAKIAKQYDRVDLIRAWLKEIGVVVRDMKQGTTWAYDE
jgi:cysteinyl-tRNA synthetase